MTTAKSKAAAKPFNQYTVAEKKAFLDALSGKPEAPSTTSARDWLLGAAGKTASVVRGVPDTAVDMYAVSKSAYQQAEIERKFERATRNAK